MKFFINQQVIRLFISENGSGIFWMIITGILFCAMTACVKTMGTSLSASQSGFIRYVFGLIILAPFCLKLDLKDLRKKVLSVLILRGSIHSLAVIAWFYAIARIPMADVTALYYLVPIFVMVGASYFFNEQLSVIRGSCIIIAFFGTIIILRPGLREISLGHLSMLLATIAFGISFLLAKKVTSDVKPIMIVFMLTLIVTIWLAPIAFIQWRDPPFQDLIKLALVAAFATSAHLTMYIAFKTTPLNITQPIVFLDLVWAVLVGLIVFGERIDVWVLVGGSLIVIAISLLGWHDIKSKNQAIRR